MDYDPTKFDTSTMPENVRKAVEELQALGAPIYYHGDKENQWNAEFIIGGELRDSDDHYYADYYQEELREHLRPIKAGEDTTHHRIIDGKVVENAFGIRTDVNVILHKHGLYAEWIDAGTAGAYPFI